LESERVRERRLIDLSSPIRQCARLSDTSGLQVGLHTRVVFRIDIGGTIRFDISAVSIFLF
jgi:hypothetical protein